VAVSAGFAPAALGSETCGSLISPASKAVSRYHPSSTFNFRSRFEKTDLSLNSGIIHYQAEASFNFVPSHNAHLRTDLSLHPEYSTGLISGAGCIPISSTLDRVGPMAKTAYDAALLLQLISGPDPKDEKSKSKLVPFQVIPVNKTLIGFWVHSS